MREIFGEEEVSSLWRSYSKRHERETRDLLVEHYMPLVSNVAGRIAISLPSHVDRDDLISSGFFGLLDAVERYDYTRQNKFETYARVRIRGAMLDYLRESDWIPSSVRKQIKLYEKTTGDLEEKLGRAATDEEIAAAMGIGKEDIARLLNQINAATIVPLDDYTGVGMPGGVLKSPTEDLEKKELLSELAKAIDSLLSEKERQVVALYYHEELTMKEISLVMQISEARVCQIHAKAVMRLRGHLKRQKLIFSD